MKTVLIFWLGYNSPVTVDFYTKAACDTARETIMEAVEYNLSAGSDLSKAPWAMCFPKS